MSNFCRFAKGGAKISMTSYFMKIIFSKKRHFNPLILIFSSSEVLGKNAYFRSKLPSAACWSRDKREEAVKPICFMSKAT